MERRRVLILGGARSGKSTYAQQIAAGISDRVIFVATAEALDVDMKARIEKHKTERPASWETLEVSTGVADAISPRLMGIDVVLLDCITLLVTNLLLGDDRGFSPDEEIDSGSAEYRIVAEMEALVDLMRRTDATFIIVSNEVGLGVVPENQLARLYRDLLGRANQLLAQNMDEVYLMVAGIPMRIK